MKRSICLAIVAVFAFCLSVTAQPDDSKKKKKGYDAFDKSAAPDKKAADADAAKKAADDKIEKAFGVAEDTRDAKLIAAAKRLRETEKALAEAWTAYKGYKKPIERDYDAKMKEWTMKKKEADDAGKKFVEPSPTLQPYQLQLITEAAKEYREALQKTLGGLIINQGKETGVQGPIINGTAPELERLSQANKHMDLMTAEQTKLFATVLNCLADRELAFLELEKQTKDNK